MAELLARVPGFVSYSTLIPPALFVLLTLLGVLLAWRWRRAGLAVATAAALCLYASATPIVALLLIRWCDSLGEAAAAAAGPTPPPGAIVVLSADIVPSNIPGVPDRPGRITLERLTAAAHDARRLKLPVMVSGGLLPRAHQTLAAVMAEALRNDFGISVAWQEGRSRNTFENALYSAAMLRQAGIGSAYLVCHSWDMARAVWAFRRVGYPVVPLPVPKGAAPLLSAADFLPSIPALQQSYYALHELIGLSWYRLRYRELAASERSAPPELTAAAQR